MPVQERLLAGIDLGGTNIRVALSPLARPRERRVWQSIETPPGMSPEAFLERVSAEISAGLATLAAPPEALCGIGCVAPGITDGEKGVIQYATNLGWRDVPLAAMLAERFGVPAVVENDVNAAALAEYTCGTGQQAHSLVYLTVSTGVAVGIVVEGRLWRGAHHAAGEIGYFLPEPRHIGQDWGENGCLEMTAGGIGLARAWARHRGGNGVAAEAVEVFNRARDGHPEAVALVRRAANYLAQAVVAIGALIDPEIVVLGGSIAQNEPALVARIREVVSMTLPHPMPVLHSNLGGDAPMLGALILAARHVATPVSDAAGTDA
ncbi:MAG: sugar kinase [Rhodothermaceae bacterium]|nr:MAG: sugar kinase [Rhodothermaceae bacterium]